jgi:hypothetical protein
MQEFPALTYKVKELHAAIQNRMSLFADAQHVKRKFRLRPRRFTAGLAQRSVPSNGASHAAARIQTVR